MKIAVSACLLGHNCKYNGKNNRNETILSLAENHTLIPVCPEVMGGMPTPRVPCEQTGGRVIDKTGKDQTSHFQSGADKALELLEKEGCQLVILQPRSPSCGAGQIYDGSFSGTLVPGDGIFAKKLKERGIPCINADVLEEQIRLGNVKDLKDIPQIAEIPAN